MHHQTLPYCCTRYFHKIRFDIPTQRCAVSHVICGTLFHSQKRNSPNKTLNREHVFMLRLRSARLSRQSDIFYHRKWFKQWIFSNLTRQKYDKIDNKCANIMYRWLITSILLPLFVHSFSCSLSLVFQLLFLGIDYKCHVICKTNRDGFR